MTPLRTEIRAIVDQAHAAGKPISAALIWGLVTRDVPEASLLQTLSIMCQRKCLVKETAPDGTFERRGTMMYLPGPEPVPDTGKPERSSGMLGNMAHRRLMEARKTARRWAV